MRCTLALSALAGALACAPAAAPPLPSPTATTVTTSSSKPRVELVADDANRRIDVVVGGRPFTSYIYPAVLKKPVLFPIRTATGLVVTRGWPLEPRPGERVDHPHHVGLWLNYENVNGLDFWNNSDAIKPENASKMGTIVHRSAIPTSGDGEGSLDVTADWVDAQGKVLLHERTRYVFRAAGNVRAIDRTTTLTAAEQPVAFPDAKDGMLGLRVRRELELPSTKAEVFTDASGRATPVPVLNNEGVTGNYHTSEGVEGEAAWGTRGRWASLSGVVEGQPVTIAILDHPRNVGFPTYWHARGYGLFAANPLGQKIFSNGKQELGFALAAGQSTTFRYRVLIVSGAMTPASIEQEYADFAASAQ
ncbi:MAG: PmoA family protein [Gemmatimonadaceae bacterium]|nr:PmoA family protein [Gemmatimonadaceae bacterium]NUQ93284.1 PmoA family protein [Gemmatimonadaceae bacterium]NUR18936.1 PmoA family protein [Gemmatimonadaceae bacterium]NUS97045.1 PmoA family protein [Gemmatimonadaceae bacterium]